MVVRLRLALMLLATIGGGASAEPRVLDAKLHHLRVGLKREWTDFNEKPEAAQLSVRFQSARNDGEWSLRLLQQDVRQTWNVRLNGKEIGRLRPDENAMVVYLTVPAGTVLAGENTLVIEQVGNASDDVRVGEIVLDERPTTKVMNEATVEVRVTDGDSPGKSAPLPCRITVTDARGNLMTVGAVSGAGLAVRPGVIYTANGTARFGLPAGGEYRITAGRGFAYGVDATTIFPRAGNFIQKSLTIRREVPTPGYASCDTHIHTLTYSGHGDADVDEQVLAIAGEGLELPIATEHNRQISLHAAAVKQGVRKFFTPVVGNEVTTAFGHFNAFPLRPDGPVPNFNLKDWKSIFASIDAAGAKVVILNHPRDLHSGFRPFGAERHVGLSGERLDGWELKATGMEVVNSGAQQSDPMRLFRDWFGLLNRGVFLTPIGASDSHDVSRYFVGQGRTYVRCTCKDPGKIDIDEVVESFRKGRVMVSCGLLAEITVNGKYGPGDLVPPSDEVKVAVRVLGPSWVRADHVALYANGYKIREAKTGFKDPRLPPGVKWSGEWTLPKLLHDVHLVAIASGPGVTDLYWPIAKPYQATSPVVERRVLGASGAVWIDGDGDGKRTSAYEYARRAERVAGPEISKLIRAIAVYDEAVAVQTASLLQARGVSVLDAAIQAEAGKAGAHVVRGFDAFAEAWRECQVAKAEKQ